MSFDISLLQPKERRKEIHSEVGRKYQYDEENINGMLGDASMHKNVFFLYSTHLSGDFNVFLPCCQISNVSVNLVSWYPSDLIKMAQSDTNMTQNGPKMPKMTQE